MKYAISMLLLDVNGKSSENWRFLRHIAGLNEYN